MLRSRTSRENCYPYTGIGTTGWNHDEGGLGEMRRPLHPHRVPSCLKPCEPLRKLIQLCRTLRVQQVASQGFCPELCGGPAISRVFGLVPSRGKVPLAPERHQYVSHMRLRRQNRRHVAEKARISLFRSVPHRTPPVKYNVLIPIRVTTNRIVGLGVS